MEEGRQGIDDETLPSIPDWWASWLFVSVHTLRTPRGVTRMWLAQWLRDKRPESTDRFTHEPVLVETLQTAGSYDHLILGRLAALEIVARRVQLTAEPHANPQTPNWDTSKFFSGTSAAGDSVSLDLKQYVLKKAKDAVDVENLCCRGRGMKGTEHVGGVGSSPDESGSGVWDG